ncbi:MAG: hypothetical protein M3535_10190 [Actinomycetota bacterium]|nr:hypothetical protein [Actinomycetota bacterium]
MDIDDDLLERERGHAGTSTIKATVEAGLRRLSDESLVRPHVERLQRPQALDVVALEVAQAPRLQRDG